MNRIFPLILCLVCMTSCNQYSPPLHRNEEIPSRDHQVVEIEGYLPTSQIPVSRGQGVMIDPETILTSTHVVGDDSLRYVLVSSDQPRSLIVGERDRIRDRAILSLTHTGRALPQLSSYVPGETISVTLLRSGSVRTFTGILDIFSGASIYDTHRGVVSYSGMILSGITIFPGESGAPVYNTRGELIDTVHIASKK